ncbi:hypothetical protein Bca52824_031208 [Brassica carinata]|uniref:Uncharacterized protein n=1 Tax=Brassica carinata TaxID=52824 RepID=A0A8X7SA87_BRACI|nr:hypothetical protein Bca52824_031208 [Brassica carinata]
MTPSILVDESWPCDLSVINGSDSPRSLRTVEDRYPISTILQVPLHATTDKYREDHKPQGY